MDKVALIKQIEESFKDAVRPHVFVRKSFAHRSDWEVQWFSDKPLLTVDQYGYVEALEWRSGWRYMTPEAFVYLLPKNLVLSLDFAEPDILEELVPVLSPSSFDPYSKWLEEVAGKLSADNLSTLIAYFDLVNADCPYAVGVDIGSTIRYWQEAYCSRCISVDIT
ncbi:MAG TPA: hypothetical protein VGK19_01080 [Capsulimonadaceae bacterium]|jgi:hypothetical protein